MIWPSVWWWLTHCVQRENFQGPFQSWKVQVWSFHHNFHPKSQVCDIWLSEISGELQEWTHDNFRVISCSQIVLLSIISIAIYLLISMSTDMGYLLSPLGPKDALTIFLCVNDSISLWGKIHTRADIVLCLLYLDTIPHFNTFFLTKTDYLSSDIP